ncbi:hypothetical protein THAOC_32347 [Thalassiosira oceanica]|uniref:Uncharacterized protein n=1 Tax=Thalassiosira oceanica TaxID=159749 RepID=K0R7E1_THAOC|nr:hypothetical protein THAOC_32347 [Thalassiosira oceanica]|eukprot:EJK48825.1 hypothetical protein THAOC_32347 [Thalassiosira oceanica]
MNRRCVTLADSWWYDAMRIYRVPNLVPVYGILGYPAPTTTLRPHHFIGVCFLNIAIVLSFDLMAKVLRTNIPFLSGVGTSGGGVEGGSRPGQRRSSSHGGAEEEGAGWDPSRRAGLVDVVSWVDDFFTGRPSGRGRPIGRGQLAGEKVSALQLSLLTPANPVTTTTTRTNKCGSRAITQLNGVNIEIRCMDGSSPAAAFVWSANPKLNLVEWEANQQQRCHRGATKVPLRTAQEPDTDIGQEGGVDGPQWTHSATET